MIVHFLPCNLRTMESLLAFPKFQQSNQNQAYGLVHLQLQIRLFYHFQRLSLVGLGRCPYQQIKTDLKILSTLLDVVILKLSLWVFAQQKGVMILALVNISLVLAPLLKQNTCCPQILCESPTVSLIYFYWIAGYNGIEWTTTIPVCVARLYPTTVFECAFVLEALPFGCWSFQAIIQTFGLFSLLKVLYIGLLTASGLPLRRIKPLCDSLSKQWQFKATD